MPIESVSDQGGMRKVTSECAEAHVASTAEQQVTPCLEPALKRSRDTACNVSPIARWTNIFVK